MEHEAIDLIIPLRKNTRLWQHKDSKQPKQPKHLKQLEHSSHEALRAIRKTMRRETLGGLGRFKLITTYEASWGQPCISFVIVWHTQIFGRPVVQRQQLVCPILPVSSLKAY
ncbi:hypothetical protein OAG71_00090 [bacterium]|nr:hypothetical protein [bacterium]